MRANTGHLSPGSEVPGALPRQLSLTRRVSGVLLQYLLSPFCPCVPVEMGLSPYLGLLMELGAPLSQASLLWFSS